MEVKFGTTTKRKNSTLIPTVTGDLGDCLLKSPCSVVEPSFDVFTTEWADYNYCYVPLFHRYYFITDIVSQYDGCWTITCAVDVLATYKTGIMNTTAFVERAESAYNPLIPDGALQISLGFEDITREFIEMGGMNTTTGTYVLGVSGLNAYGNTGFVTAYALSQAEFSNITMMFFTDSKLEEMSKYNANPITSIAFCKWVPLEKELISEGLGQIFVGNSSLDISASYAKKTYSSHTEITVRCPYYTTNPITGVTNYGDYRNTPPYTTTELMLPGVGLVELDTAQLLGTGENEIRIYIQYDVSPVTGDIVYTIEDMNHSNQLVMVVNGNFAVDLPVSGITANYMGEKLAQVSAISAGITSIIGVAGLASGSPQAFGALTSGMAGVAQASQQLHSARQHHTTIMGSMGGWAGQYLNGGIYIVQRKYPLSGNASAIGRPYYNTAKLANFSGYVKCSGAYVGVAATDYEHDALINLINGGFYVE